VVFEESSRNGYLVAFTAKTYQDHDALVLQVTAAGVGTRDLSLGYETIGGSLFEGIDGAVLEAASADTLGISVLYWAAGEYDWTDAAVASDIEALPGTGDVLQAGSDIGRLFMSRIVGWPNAPTVSQDRWVLLSRPGVEGLVDSRFLLECDNPPPFVAAAIARHKSEFEWNQFQRAHAKLKELNERLGQTADAVLDAQRLKHPCSRADQWLEFREVLVDAADASARFQEALSYCRALRRTLEINRSTFVMCAPALLSEAGHVSVQASPRREEASEAFLDQANDAALFGSEVGRMTTACRQVDADLDYMEQALRRHDVVRQSGQLQLQSQLEVSSQAELREMAADLREMSKLHNVEAAAVVASLVGFVVVELLKLGEERSLSRRHPSLAFHLVLLAVFAAFAIARIPSTRASEKSWLDRISFALATGIGIGALGVWLWPSVVTIVPDLAFVGLGALLGLFVYANVESTLRFRSGSRDSSV
jgi:hypothetical protein